MDNRPYNNFASKIDSELVIWENMLEFSWCRTCMQTKYVGKSELPYTNVSELIYRGKRRFCFRMTEFSVNNDSNKH